MANGLVALLIQSWVDAGEDVSKRSPRSVRKDELLDQHRGILAELDRTIADIEREGSGHA
jgi:hypothetical protein